MDKNKIKRDVLQSLIDEMDNHIVDGLKSKSPKFQKVEVLAEEPTQPEEESDEQEMSSDMTDEDKEKLIELYKKLKG